MGLFDFFGKADRQVLLNIQANVRLIMADVRAIKDAFSGFVKDVNKTIDDKNKEIQDLKDSIQAKIDAAIEADDAGEEVEIQQVLTSIQAEADKLKPIEAPETPPESRSTGGGSSG